MQHEAQSQHGSRAKAWLQQEQASTPARSAQWSTTGGAGMFRSARRMHHAPMHMW